MIKIQRFDDSASTVVSQLDVLKYSMDDSIISVEVLDGIESIPNGAFCNCRSLQRLVLGACVKSLEGNTFKGCEKLVSVTVESPELEFDLSDFEGCDKMDLDSLPKNVAEKIKALRKEKEEKDAVMQEKVREYWREVERQKEKAKEEGERRAYERAPIEFEQISNASITKIKRKIDRILEKNLWLCEEYVQEGVQEGDELERRIGRRIPEAYKYILQRTMGESLSTEQDDLHYYGEYGPEIALFSFEDLDDLFSEKLILPNFLPYSPLDEYSCEMYCLNLEAPQVFIYNSSTGEMRYDERETERAKGDADYWEYFGRYLKEMDVELERRGVLEDD